MYSWSLDGECIASVVDCYSWLLFFNQISLSLAQANLAWHILTATRQLFKYDNTCFCNPGSSFTWFRISLTEIYRVVTSNTFTVLFKATATVGRHKPPTWRRVSMCFLLSTRKMESGILLVFTRFSRLANLYLPLQRALFQVKYMLRISY